MRRLQSVLLATVAAIGFASIASAADMPVKARMAPVPVAYNWTGCYIGANVGGTWGRSNETIPAYPATFDINMSSLAGGGQVGCNYMFPQRWVIGLEGDFSWTDLKGDAPTTAGTERYFQRWNWMSTARGRLGYAPDNWLFYITGGAAWAHLNSAYFTTSTSVSGTHSGWTFGGGVEYGLTPNWIIGAEYLYAQFQRVTYTCTACGPVNFDLKTNTIRARLSYKF